MEEFGQKVTLSDAMDVDSSSDCSKILCLLRKFQSIQHRRAEAYSKLHRGFREYMFTGRDSNYQQLCSEITIEFNDCSQQVLEIESLFLKPDCFRDDLAQLLRTVQEQEKRKLHLTATIQVLKKSGRPSERLVSREGCRFEKRREHIEEISEAAGTEEAKTEAEADAEYEDSLREAIKGLQEAVMIINEHLEEVRYEIAALDMDNL